LDKIKELEEENKKIVPEELANKIEFYEKEIEELKEQVERLSKQQAQIKTPPKDKGIKSFFKLGGKK
jgi:prefoldin subunit 5